MSNVLTFIPAISGVRILVVFDLNRLLGLFGRWLRGNRGGLFLRRTVVELKLDHSGND